MTHATATETPDLAACPAAYCRAGIGEKCRSVLGKPMDACHWPRIKAATELRRIVASVTKPTEYEETP